MVVGLTADMLMQIEAELCRSLHRPGWCRGAQGNVGPIGRVCRKLFDRRNEFADDARINPGQQFPQLTQAELADTLNVKHPRLADFLNGNPPGRGWTNRPYQLIRLLLLGNARGAHHTPEQLEVAGRILEFFFPYGNTSDQVPPDGEQDLWYFAERFRRSAWPQTPREGEAEIRSLAFAAAKEGVRCRLIRVSSRLRFPQVTLDLQNLEKSGERSIDALQAGVKMIFIFPANNSSSMAAKSAVAFEAMVKQRVPEQYWPNLRLVPLEEDQSRLNRHASDYFSPLLRFTWYERDGRCNCFLISRARVTCAFEPFADEIEAFRQWLEPFLQ